MNIQNTVFIIGASRGIGKSIAFEFARNGWNLFLTARNLDDLTSVQKEIQRHYSVKCEINVLDVTLDSDFEKTIDKFSANFETLDLVIFNSGISEPILLKDIDIDLFRKIFETNFFGIVNGLKHFVEYFKKQSFGKIAIVSSLADARGFPGSSAYTASKSAISHVTEAARIELKSLNIEVISVKPGFVKTDMTANHKFHMPFLISSEKYAKNFYQGIVKGKKRIYYPYPTAFLTYLLKIIPSSIYDFLMRFWRGENAKL